MTFTQTEINVPVDGTITPAKIASGDFYFDTDTLYIDATNNRVGIGTSSPAYKLDVVGNVNGSVTSAVQNSNAGTSGFARFLSIADAGNAQFGMTSSTYTDITGATDSMLLNANSASGGIAFALDGVLKMKLDSSGNVGIGTTSPSYLLDVESVSGTDNILNVRNPSSSWGEYALARFQTDSKDTRFIDIGYYRGLAESERAFIINGQSSNRLFTILEASGNVGIGTDSPTEKLDVNGGAVIKGSLTNAAGTGSALRMQHFSNISEISSLEPGVAWRELRLNASEQTFYIAGGERMRIDASGNVRIGTTGIAFSSGEKTSIINSAASGQGLGIKTITATAQCLGLWNADNGGTRKFVDFAVSSGGAGVGSITSNGSTTAYNTTSDARLKDVTGSARGLEVINALNPVAFNWKADGRADEGLLAQEVLEIVPNAVTGSEEEMYQMDYSKLVTHLIAGMKEQQTIIEDLKTRIETLENN
jgi:hypothetical protein